MAARKSLWVCLALPSLLAPVAISAPAPTDETQYVLQAAGDGDGDGRAGNPNPHPHPQSQSQSQRKLHGRFLHITDLHPDEHYKAHTSTEEGHACHRGHGPAGAYGAETSDCDSPMSLVNATFDWISTNLLDSIDFVVWTGDSARHDSDDELPRHNKDILEMNRRIADGFVDTFSDEKGLVVPVVPTFGNNDVYPHNIMMPGPNDILRTYMDIWRSFIPEAQRHSFEYGGWFYVEVIPNKLAVVSLNTMYFFDRNAGVDDCVHPSEPGYKHFEWLRVQLDSLRKRGMKAILMGHVPPARTSGKQLWDETCWQKYTLWLQQYRDVIAGSLYGHMNIDHFLLQDTKEIDVAMIKGSSRGNAFTRDSMEEEFSVESSADYLLELRDNWSKLPNPVILDQDVDESGKKKKHKKKKKKGKNKLGGPWAERYQLTLIGPSVVPNYFPTLRVVEYNITGLETTPTWMNTMRASDATQEVLPDFEEEHQLELRGEDSDFDIDGKKKKKGKKGKKGKKPKDPNLHVPSPPGKKEPPGPAYAPQPLTFLGYTQYFANLTRINNDIDPDATDGDLSPNRWDPGQHKDKTPKHKKPQPKEFKYEVEYTTFDDTIYKLKDLTVKSFVDLAHRIGKASAKSEGFAEELDHDDNDDDDEDEKEEEADESVGHEREDGSNDSQVGEDDESEKDEDLEIEKKKHKEKKNTKVWFHFLKHAFVGTKSEKELKKLE